MKKRSVILVVLSLVVVAGFASIFLSNPKPMTYPPEMIHYSPSDSYEDDWKQVAELEKKGLVKSALELVNGIYDKAAGENNQAQQAKALFYILKYTQQVEEEPLVKNVARLQAEVHKAKFPLRPLLQSVLADQYWSYYLQNQWRFQNRTETEGIVETDIRTWDLRKIVERTTELHFLALQNKDSLQRTAIGYFDDVLDKHPDSRKYRPTLYDFLAHRAIRVFENDVLYLSKPAYQFQLEGKAAFGTGAEFTAQDYSSQDSASFKLLALQLYQELTRLHSADQDPDARIMLAIERLQFAKANSVLAEKEDAYIAALETLLKKNAGHPASAWVAYHAATWYQGQATKFNALDKAELHKTDNQKAVAICQKAIAAYPKSDGAKNCKALLFEIEAKSMSLQVEQINLPNQPFRSLLSYKNLNKVWFRIVEVDEKQLREFKNKSSEDLVNKFKNMPVAASWEQELPKDEDYNAHAVELAIPKLEKGYYAILASDNADFSQKGHAVAYTLTWASRLAYSTRSVDNQKIEVFLTDRETGAPLSDVSCQLYTQEYDYNKRAYNWRKGPGYTSDKDGYFNVPAISSQSNSFYFEFTFEGEKVRTEESWYLYKNNPQPEKHHRQTIFFTDRGIYRPGQTVYFKGIVLDRYKDQSSIMPGTASVVVLKDANYQEVAKLKLTANEFGSFQGTFVIPQGLMNGQFHLNDAHGGTTFSVEDYKRPKFEVTFEPIKGSFKLGEKVKISGKAVAYAGSNIDGAEVKYRVVRTASFPYWGYWGRGRYMPSSPEMEITNGGSSTDEKGTFEVEFAAIPDREIAANLKPQFSYTIYVDVVDITGETHSANQSVSVGYLALNADLAIPETVEAGTRNEFAIRTRNLNGEFEAASGKIIVHQLQEPDRIFRDRLWGMPDKFQMTQAEYYNKFPHDVYRDENDFHTWKKGKEVLSTNFDSKKEDTLTIAGLQNWQEGKYVAEMTTKDKFGTEVKVLKYFTLYKKESKQIPLNETEWFATEKATAEPGEEAVFYLGTAEKQLRVLYEIERKGKVVSREWVSLKNEKRRFSVPVEEGDRGNFAVHLSTVRNGRFYSHDILVNVPWTNKNLKIAFETFRDKLQPGQKEEWKIRISSPDGDGAAAELLAGMYDASLDAFRSVSWGLNVNSSFYSRRGWRGSQAFTVANSVLAASDWNPNQQRINIQYESLNHFGYYGLTFGWNQPGSGGFYRNQRTFGGEMDMMVMEQSEPMADDVANAAVPAPASTATSKLANGNASFAGGKDKQQQEFKAKEGKKSGAPDMGDIQVRTNLNELAFFYPQLRTDANGDVVISYTVPEALTRWRIMLLAHTKDLKTGYTEKSLVTQKELMIMPNPPRFFRENDEIYFTAKVSNLSDKDLSGNAVLELFDALTMKPIDVHLENNNATKRFTAKKGQSAPLAWRLKIPTGIQAVTFRVKAQGGAYTDGEESALPVLTNSMLVTEAMPLPVRPMQTKTFSFDKLRNHKSSTLRNHKYTLEFTSNPAWYAIQALPYLIEYPYECTEQVFSRYYANALASHIANSHPRIKAVFESWKTKDKEALLSNLEKNQELKALLLEETPWVLNAQDESERKKRVGLLFDLNKMSYELNRALTKLQKSQVSNGGWTWFPGMPESRYITQHVVTGMGHLDHLGVKAVREDSKTWNMVQKAVRYLDNRIRDDYNYLVKNKLDLSKNHLGRDQIQYLYARSYFQDLKVDSKNRKAFDYYSDQAKEFWLENSLYLQGMIALSLHRQKVSGVPADIVKSIKEKSLQSEEMGMYWKNANAYCVYWYQAPIERQALLIEAFDEVTNDQASVEEMKLWLLKQKQTQDWKTTKATVEACYALLLRGTDLLAESEIAEITIGGKVYDPKADPSTKVEAGTGYFKTSWMGSEITPKMGEVKVKNRNNVAAWGAVYWQYFEQLDKITFAETNLKLEKQLFLERNTPTGPKISPVTEATKLKPGDKLKVRILLETDRDLEYVHLKDMRASGFEPINVMSRYRYQDGLGYYESTRDAATNFFMHWLPKGKYVFEYPLRVNHRGDFSNGITTVQCMYAPEFVAHSEGIRVQVGEGGK